jgi:hypothetical protein
VGAPANGDPTHGGGDVARTINWSVNDGVANSALAGSTLHVAHIAPSLTAGAVVVYISNSTPAPTLEAGLVLTAPDSGGHITGATVAIGAGFAAGDQLVFVDQDGITGAYNAATGVLTLSGVANASDYQSALQSVAYSFNPVSGDPTNFGADTARSITWQVNDGVASSTTVSSTLDIIPGSIPAVQDLTNAFTNALWVTPNSPLVTAPTILLADGTTVPNPLFADAATLITLETQVAAGQITVVQALQTIEQMAATTTTVSTLSYEFFTGLTPNAGGYQYLISSPANPNNLDSPYYAKFSEENRFINFAVNLGKLGQGQPAFNATYGAGTLSDAATKAYTEIFGFAPAAGKIDTILNTMITSNGITETRGQYFAFYGGDGLNGLGTKAAMVGWLMVEAVKADLGPYATSNDAFLNDLVTGHAHFNIDLLPAYGQVHQVPLIGV